MAGLSIVEFLEEVGGDDGVVADEGVEVMVCRRWGVDQRVRISRHPLSMEDAEGVATEGGVGVTVLDGGVLPRSSTPGFLLWSWFDRFVEVPRRGR